MSTVFTKTLTFRWRDLGTNATLLLIFDKFQDGMYRDKFPVCWQAIGILPQGPFFARMTYCNQIAVFKPQINETSDRIMKAVASQEINPGQKTTLFRSDNGDYAFTVPEADFNNNMRGYNGTPNTEAMAVGFILEDVPYPIPLFFSPRVGPGSFTDAQFTPIVCAYIVSDFQASQIVRGEIDSPVIWETNLATLHDDTTWNLEYNRSRGAFTITAA